MNVQSILASDRPYEQIWFGNDHPEGVTQVLIDISVMTTAEVDAQGMVKPGVPLTQAGILVGAAVAVFGVTYEPVKRRTQTSIVGADNANLAADTADFFIGVITSGTVSRRAIEANLGRVLTANEIAGFDLAPCKIKLVA